MEEYVFERATEADLDELMQNIEDAKHYGMTDWDEEYPSREQIAEDVAAGGTFVLRGNDGIAASIFMHQDDEEMDDLSASPGISWAKTPRPCGLSRLCVRSKLQNRGMGKLMMEHIMAEAKKRGCTGVRLLASVGNPAANSLYRRLGCKELGITHIYDWEFTAYEKLI